VSVSASGASTVSPITGAPLCFGRLALDNKRGGKKECCRAQFHLVHGAQGRNRTTDTAIFSRMLYQLSYLGERFDAPKPGFIETGAPLV
jgi:hypothetical protein